MTESKSEATPSETEIWHTLKVNRGAREDGLEAGVGLPIGSLWFRGHFPGQPILPGVALLALAAETVSRGEPFLRVSGFRKIRFRMPVQPGETLTVKASPDPRDPLKSRIFTILGVKGVICSGAVRVIAEPSGLSVSTREDTGKS